MRIAAAVVQPEPAPALKSDHTWLLRSTSPAGPVPLFKTLGRRCRVGEAVPLEDIAYMPGAGDRSALRQHSSACHSFFWPPVAVGAIPYDHACEKLFRTDGLPKAMRMDNGIGVEDPRPGYPHDNDRHERMRRWLKPEYCQPPAPTSRSGKDASPASSSASTTGIDTKSLTFVSGRSSPASPRRRCHVDLYDQH